MDDHDLDLLVASLAPVRDDELIEPTPELARRAAALTRADAADAGSGPPPIPGDGPPPPPRSPVPGPVPRARGRVLVAAGLAVALLAGAATVVALARDDEVQPGQVEVVPTPAPAPVAMCGAAFPLPFNVPDGFTPSETLVTDSNDPAPGQLIARWRSATGELELRWPADPVNAASLPVVPEDLPPLSGSVSADSQNHSLPDGRATRLTFGRLSGIADPTSPSDCQTFQWRVTDSDPLRVGAVTEHLRERPFDLAVGPLVENAVQVDALPPLIPCESPMGTLPSRTVEVAATRAATSASVALEEFVGPADLPTEGYTALELADDSVVYAWSPVGRTEFAILVYARRTAGGWVISRYDRSAC